jgi:hypothetical protein
MLSIYIQYVRTWPHNIEWRQYIYDLPLSSSTSLCFPHIWYDNTYTLLDIDKLQICLTLFPRFLLSTLLLVTLLLSFLLCSRYTFSLLTCSFLFAHMFYSVASLLNFSNYLSALIIVHLTLPLSPSLVRFSTSFSSSSWHTLHIIILYCQYNTIQYSTGQLSWLIE